MTLSVVNLQYYKHMNNTKEEIQLSFNFEDQLDLELS